MDELESIKSAASPAARRHPEDVDSDDYSDQEDSHLNHEDGKDEDGDDDDPDIPISAAGLSRDMPSFKHTSKLSLSGSFQTVCCHLSPTPILFILRLSYCAITNLTINLGC